MLPAYSGAYYRPSWQITAVYNKSRWSLLIGWSRTTVWSLTRSLWTVTTWRLNSLGPVSISDKTSYCKISKSLEVARFVFRIVPSLWNLTGTSAAERWDDINYQSRGFETSWALTTRRLSDIGRGTWLPNQYFRPYHADELNDLCNATKQHKKEGKLSLCVILTARVLQLPTDKNNRSIFSVFVLGC